ncbi:MAG: hypothetical protein A3J29_05145 [Acidobacteria bacterium RIFCSPLOWO2_12_FULL_67_14b]|nr:MAG: hypothetical protein A3J29_05145 [Acidobacteria bacterium RIFCSPLOWO2_12_FULL_67_14b]
MSTDSSANSWLLLLFQLPARPTAARVRTWRQLQRLGALPVRNSGYALPHSPAAREDFEWLRADIVAAGGDAMVFVASAADQAADEELRLAFRSARAADFDTLRKTAVQLGRTPQARRGRRPGRDIRGLADRLAHLETIDFFAAPNAAAARAAVGALLQPAEEVTVTTAHETVLRNADYQRRTWVTRPRPGIDRFASAWLIRRFIDPGARFTFAESIEAARLQKRQAVPFDMFGAEFGHAASGCTFETLVRRFAIEAPGIAWLARIVHALDLKENDAAVPEAAALGRIVEGLRQLHPQDDVLLERGVDVIEAYYRSRPAEPGKSGARSPKKTARRKARPA